MKFSERDRRAIVFGVVGLMVILAARLAVIPWFDSWAQARERISKGGAELNDMARDVRRVLAQRRRLEQTYGPAVEGPLEATEQARVNLLKAVQEVVKSSGFKPSKYNPQRARVLAEVPGSQMVGLRMPGECDAGQLVKFLAGLRKSKTLVLVESLRITNDEKKPGKLKVVMVLTALAEQEKAGS